MATNKQYDPYSNGMSQPQYRRSIGLAQQQPQKQQPLQMDTSMGMTRGVMPQQQAQQQQVPQMNTSMGMTRGVMPQQPMQTQGIINNPMFTPPTGQQPPATGQQQQPMQQPGTQAGFPNRPDPYMPYDWNQYSSGNETQQGAMSQWAQMQLPFQQFQQNSWQYGQDFNEAQRRWNAEMQNNQGLQQWQQGFSTRQQDAAEWQQQMAAQQWGQQFGFETDYANRQLGFQQGQHADDISLRNAQQQHQYGVDNRQLGMNQQQIDNQAGQFAAQMGLDYANMSQQDRQYMANLSFQQTQHADDLSLRNQQQLHQYGMDNRQMGLAELANQQQFGLGNRGMGLQELANQQQFGLGNRQQSLAELAQQQQYGLGRLQSDRNFQLGQGDLRLQRDQQNLAQWQAGQNVNLAERGLISGNRQFQDTHALNRAELASRNQQFGQNLSFQQLQQQQQMQLEQQRLAEQARQANLQAVGRSQAPNVNWLRRS